MDLSFLFEGETLLEQMRLSEDTGYMGEASYVWRVKTPHDTFVARTSAFCELESERFWYGHWKLFGVDPREVFALEQINRMLGERSDLRVPQVRKKALHEGLEFVVVDYLPGQILTDFREQSSELLEGFGRSMAQIHQRSFAHYGNAAQNHRNPLGQFHDRFADVMEQLVVRFYLDIADEPEQAGVAELLPMMQQLAKTLPEPQSASLIMIDMDPGQFLVEGQRVTAVVDTEGYVIAPREMDLVALEYILDERSASAFRKGYTSILDMPDLQQVRPLYRYFHRLTEVQGSPPIKEWMDMPILF